ncbi:MAG TPA: TonB-dependent receptor [Paucimonas sp.]|nr:TonB-dependent receptor [Paucimonas sp.]
MDRLQYPTQFRTVFDAASGRNPTMMIKLSPLAGAVLMSVYAMHAHAQDADPPARDPNAPPARESKGRPQGKEEGKRPETEVKQVTITGGRQNETEQRRQSTAAKLVFGREELDRNGDSTVGEILKRLPGVTVSGRPGRGGGIQMRGLGSGYTQILLNGERPPLGFSLDSLSPDQIERIEVYRAPVVEFSTQAIAGTINIVLREDFKMKQTQVNVSYGVEQGRRAPNVSVTHPGQVGALSYVLSGSVFENRQRTETVTETAGPAIDQDIAADSLRTTRGIRLAPRFNYRLGNGDTLMLQPFVMHTKGDTRGAARVTQTLGDKPYDTSDHVSGFDTTGARVFGNWQHRFADKSKADVKFGFGFGRNNSETTTRRQEGSELHTLFTTSSSRDRGAGTNGKYSRPVDNGHALAVGWDVEWRRNTQTRLSFDNGVEQADDSGENLGATTRRLALFAQDEWEINKEWSAYFGLRWEGVKISSALATGAVENTSSVWSPVLHGVWRIPGREKDQLRMSLTRSYRAPSLSDLVAVPVRSRTPGPTSPDRIGNPSLRPELSTGIDLAYEHYLSGTGIFSANLFMREISGLIRRRIDQQADGRWLSQPVNFGDARSGGLELEAKFQLVDFIENAPSVDVRANYSRFWSSVDGVPGPDNRLDQQAKRTANLGIDYRVKGMPLTLGGNLNWTPAYVVRTTETQTTGSGRKRQLDAYALWKFSPAMQLRLSANNLFADDYRTGSSVGSQVATVAAKTYTTWTLKLEMKI